MNINRFAHMHKPIALTSHQESFINLYTLSTFSSTGLQFHLATSLRTFNPFVRVNGLGESRANIAQQKNMLYNSASNEGYGTYIRHARTNMNYGNQVYICNFMLCSKCSLESELVYAYKQNTDIKASRLLGYLMIIEINYLREIVSKSFRSIVSNIIYVP